MQFVGSIISSIIWYRRYISFILPASSSSCFYNQIILITSKLLICKTKLVLIQKDRLIRKFKIFYCNSAHHLLNIPQQPSTQRSNIQYYQVLSCYRCPNYFKGLFIFSLKFKSPTKTPDVRV